MFENTIQSIANCLNTQRGTHVLYREFGLDVVDAANPPLRRDVQIQLAMYYPTTSLMTLSSISINEELMNGRFKYNVNITGE